MKKDYVKNEKVDAIVQPEEVEEIAQAPAEPKHDFKTVNVERLNVRLHNTPTADIVKVLSMGEKVEIAYENAGWGKLAGGSGWVKTEFLK